MTTVSERDYDELREQIRDSLRRATAHRDKLKRTNSHYGIANIVLGALAAFVTGLPAILGRSVVGNWRVVCAAAACLSLGATIVAGVNRQLTDLELLTEANACVGKLKSLTFATAGRSFNLDEMRKQYQQVPTEFPRVEC